MKLQSDNIWVTADTHYSHKNIVRGITNWITNPNYEDCMTRDFSTLEEMDLKLVNNINNSVDAEDWLIHLGDWSFGGYDKVEEFRSKINCKNVVLIIGNHDHHIQREISKFKKLFTHIAHYEELKVTKTDSNTENFVLCHYPIISWNGQHHGTRMLHGHQHLKFENRVTQTNRMDVGICGNPEFRPYNIEEIIQHLNENIVNNEVSRI